MVSAKHYDFFSSLDADRLGTLAFGCNGLAAGGVSNDSGVPLARLSTGGSSSPRMILDINLQYLVRTFHCTGND
jgi:hypothetical protein